MLAALKGSDKQIAWAERIRKTWMPLIECYVAKCVADPKMEDAVELPPLVEKLHNITSASWWIDNRTQDEIGFLMQVEN